MAWSVSHGPIRTLFQSPSSAASVLLAQIAGKDGEGKRRMTMTMGPSSPVSGFLTASQSSRGMHVSLSGSTVSDKHGMPRKTSLMSRSFSLAVYQPRSTRHRLYINGTETCCGIQLMFITHRIFITFMFEGSDKYLSCLYLPYYKDNVHDVCYIEFTWTSCCFSSV